MMHKLLSAVWAGALLLLPFAADAQQVGPGMTPNASNATLPIALTNLGLGTASTPSFLGLNLTGALGASQGLSSAGGAFLGAASTRGSTWADTYFPSIEGITPLSSIMPANTTGGYAGFFAARSSDDSGAAGTSIFSTGHLCVSDNTTVSHAVWCDYIEGHTTAGSNAVRNTHINVENSLQSAWTVATADPYTPNPTGLTENLRLDSGVGGAASNNVSNALHIINNGTNAYRHAIIVDANALDIAAGRIGPALSMATNHSIDWYSAAGNQAWRLYSSATTGNSTITLGNSGIISIAGATAELILNETTGASTQASLSFQNNGSEKWQFGKQVDDSFFLYDVSTGLQALTIGNAGAGNTVLGETGKTVTVTGLTATSAALTAPNIGAATGTSLAVTGTIVAGGTSYFGDAGNTPLAVTRTGIAAGNNTFVNLNGNVGAGDVTYAQLVTNYGTTTAAAEVGNLDFYTKNAGTSANRMRLSGAGGLSIGTTTDAGSTNLLVAGVVKNTGITSDATHTDSAVCQDTTTHQFYAGSGAAGICLGTSSLRFKTDIHALKPGLREIVALEPVDYRYKPGFGGEGVKYGFSAEQMADVMPELVGLDADGKPNSVDWAGIVPVLVKAIQEHQHEIAALKGKR